MADSTKGARLKKINKEKERTASTGRLPMILVVAIGDFDSDSDTRMDQNETIL
jgi:hypothetical protein